MRTYSKLILAALVSTAILAIAVGGASARAFSVNERNFELIWNNALTGKTKFHFIAPAASINVECNVTLLGGFSANTIAKNTGINQGTVRHGELEGCVGGTATIRTETMPWNLRYRSFANTLPRIRSINIGLTSAKLLVTGSNGLICEPQTEANHPFVSIIGNTARRTETGLEETNREPENITAEEGNRIPLTGREFLCQFGGEAEVEGVGLIRNLPRTAKLRITLI